MSNITDRENKPVYMVVDYATDYVHPKYTGDYLYTQRSAAEKRAKTQGVSVVEYKLVKV